MNADTPDNRLPEDLPEAIATAQDAEALAAFVQDACTRDPAGCSVSQAGAALGFTMPRLMRALAMIGKLAAQNAAVKSHVVPGDVDELCQQIPRFTGQRTVELANVRALVDVVQDPTVSLGARIGAAAAAGCILGMRAETVTRLINRMGQIRVPAVYGEAGEIQIKAWDQFPPNQVVILLGTGDGNLAALLMIQLPEPESTPT